ncbi:MAG: ABC transporter permease, partial [Pseudorhodoplanes sp.]
MTSSRNVERLSGLAFGILLLLAWEGICRAGLVDKLILPAPSAIATTLVNGLMGTGQLSFPIAKHTISSLTMLAIGFPLGSLAGVALGIAIGLNDTAYRMVGPVLGMLLPVPAIAWAPIALVWFGLGAPAIVAVVTYACFSEVVYNTASGVRSIPERYNWVIKTFGAGAWTQLWRVVVPAAFPQIF